MNCPKCDTSLEPANVKEIEVDRCATCGGIWFDDTELDALFGFTRKELRPLSASRQNELLDAKRGRCPRDRADLLRVYSADNRSVVIDACPRCSGIWLDGGELAKLLPT